MPNESSARIEEVDTFWAELHVSGPISVAEQICRKFCLERGLCVTINPTKYIYTGGEEEGFVVRLINYPRFPTSSTAITDKAWELLQLLIDGTHQQSGLMLTPNKTRWITTRPANK